MIKSNSLGNRLIALMLSIIMVLGMLPANVFALESTAVAQIGDVTYDKLADAIAAVPTGTNQVAPAEATTVKLLRDTAYAFDVGISTGETTMNLKLDLNGNTLTLAPSVGSVGTKANGIRVLAYSKLEIANGTILCSSETADNVKVGIANYGTLILDSVSVQAGSLTQYTVNNRGELTLKGNTAITSGSICAVTNDPYNLYYTSAVNASVTCESSDVAVESMLVERYERNSANNGVVELNISAGYFGKIVEDGSNAVGASYNVTGGVIGVSSTEELDFALNMINAGAEYSAPEKPVTIKMLSSFAGSFDVGISTGKAPKNICLDLNGNTLTLKPGVGSFNTETNGIRVLAYSKLEVKNGTLLCSSEAADKVKVGIANYGELVLDGVALKAGDQTIYTVNNRGALTLKGNTSITAGSTTAITNDPYNLYYTTDVDASVTCDSSSVSVESILVERYERNSENKGGVKLNISAGSFGKIEEDGASSVGATYTITGGSFGSDISDFCSGEYKVVKDENGNFVVKSKQANFGFEKDEYTVTFGANGNKFTTAVENAAGEVTYSFVTETDVAEINAETGELTILKAGTVQVKAMAAGNSQYAEAEDTYTLVIKPAYAEVHSFSGGTVTGSGSADAVVSIDNAVLEWVTKDESIGRTQDGWWVGIKIVAPDGVDLNKAVYQRRSGGTFDGAEVKPFMPESDRYLGMWGLITAEYLERFSNEGKNLNYVWRFSWDGDDVYEQTIAITIVPNGITLKQSGFAFGIDEETITFGEDYTARVPSGGQANKVTYSIENVSVSDTPIAEIDPEIGKLTVNKAGTVKITATLSGEHYENISDSYVLVINKAEQPDFGFADTETEVTYNENQNVYIQEVTGALGDGELTYEIISELYEGATADVAEIDRATGKLTIKQSGIVTVRASKAGDDCYKDALPATYTLKIKKANQSGFGFADTEVEVTYNDNGNKYTAVATGGQTQGDVVYNVASGNAATVNATTGEVSINKAGTVVILATRPADAKYEESTAQYNLVIKPDAQVFENTDAFKEAVSLTYGTPSYTKTVALKTPNSGNAVVYTLSDNTIADINSATGEVTFKDNAVGTVTVTASVEGKEDYYEPAESISYTITVGYLAVQEVPDFTDKWYTSADVTVSAPDGYTISKTGKLQEGWNSSVSFDSNDGLTDNSNNTVNVYLRQDSTGYITSAIPVSGIKVDTQAPTGLSVDYAEPKGIVNLLEKIGIFQKDSLDVTISATDVTSGIASLTYNIGEGDVTVPSDRLTYNGNTASYTFTIDIQYRNKITMRATDVAGWSTELADDKIIVLDTTNPVLTPGYVMGQENEYRWENNVLYSQKDVTVKFTINESNADLSGLILENANGQKTPMPVLTVNGDTKDVTDWNFIGGVLSGSYALSGEGDYDVVLTYTDAAGNAMVAFQQQIRIDTTAPVIKITDQADGNAFNGEISKNKKTAIITITEHNFKPEEVELKITATDIIPNPVDLTAKAYANYAKNADNWKFKDASGAYTSNAAQAVNPDEYYLVLPVFDIDGVYAINVVYTDLAKNAAQSVDDTVTVDQTEADNIQITYSTPIFSKIIEALSFGFYQAEVTVTVTAEDLTTGVDSFELTYTRDPKATDAHAATQTWTLQAQPGADTKTFTASKTVSAPARGSFSAKVFDKAGNASEKDDSTLIRVADAVSPKIDIKYTATNTNTSVHYVDGSKNDVAEFKDAVNTYFNGDVVAAITVKEENFFEGKKAGANDEEIVHEIIIKVTRTDDNGNVTVTEYVPKGAQQLVAGAELKEIEWYTNGDAHTVNVPFAENGDYVLEIDYTDFSEREAELAGEDGITGIKTYTSKVITVDKTKPEILVTYDNNSAWNQNNYKANRTATVQITEHNFKPEDVVLDVTAVDVTGAEVNISAKAYAAFAKNASNWSQNGNIWTLTLPVFDIEANYTVKLDYSDLAKNAEKQYTTDFVVDKTAPDANKIQIKYSNHSKTWEKVLSAVTFGYYSYKDKVEVTLTAEDLTAGVDYFTWTYTQEAGTSTENQADMTKVITKENITFSQDGKTATAKFTIDAQARGSISVTVTDEAGNTSAPKSDSGRINIVDSVSPEREVSYTPDRVLNAQTMLDVQSFAEGDNVTLYYEKEAVVTFTINEANFYAEDVVIKVNGQEKAPTDWTQNGDVWTGTITISGDGDYVVTMSYTDRSTNKMVDYKSQQIRIDNTDPTIKVEYSNNNALNSNNYKADRTATITVVDHTFRADDVQATVTAVDIMGNPVTVTDYAAYLTDRNSWTTTGDTHVANITYSTDAIHTFDISYADIIGNEAADFEKQTFVVDHKAPENVQIKYSNHINAWEKLLSAVTFGYYSYKEKVDVTLIAEDLTSGVDYFTWTYTQEAGTSTENQADMTKVITKENITFSQDGKTATAKFTIDAQARGSISVTVTDEAGNTSAPKSDSGRINIVDNISPKREVSYTPDRILDAATLLDANSFAENSNVILYYEKSAVVTFTITEANFYAEDVVIKVNGEEKVPTDWTQNGDVWTGTITISGDGDYVVTMTYTDRSTNKMVDYQSQQIRIDNTDPTIKVEYDNNTALNTNNYKADRTATITIVDHNFRADDVKVTVTAKDVQGNPVTVTDYATYLADRSSWTTTGDTHVAKITYSTDAIYTFDIEYADIIGNKAADFAKQEFVIDHTPAKNIQITYTTPVFSKIIEALSFGFYKAEVVVTVTAEDMTSGVDYFELTYTRDDKATDAHTDDFTQKLMAQPGTDAKTFTASYTVSAQARGSYSVKVFDKAGNESKANDHSSVIVTDTVSPEIKVDFAAKDSNTKVHFVDGNIKNVDTFAESTNAFFGGDVVATITVDEANFFEGKKAGANNDEIVHEIIIKVTKTDDNGVKTVKEYLCAGAKQLVTDAQKEIIEWTTNGDTHTTSITFADDGDYVLEITYSDFSKNDSKLDGNDGVSATKTYTSKIITVDETAPVIDVTYGNTEVINTIEGRKYFNKTQSAVIKVTEHNFRAEDIAAAITAKNVVDTDVNVADFAAQLANEANWKHDGNVHTAEVQYIVDANYTFDIDFMDLALNASADYTKDLFTVDTTAPKNLTVDYSTSVFEQIKESITFGYYNAMMTVTITAEDDTSGIYHFAYSYIKGKDVSGVNAELLDQAIKEAEISYAGKKATVTFSIPKMVLGADNQFNGTVEFTAFDRSEVSTELKDTRVVVVDNITPTSKITYNAPVQTANGISYYDGDINATIVINEANFDAKDVVVTVTKDGENFPVNVSWRDDSVDTHTGTFTLTKDGDYIVSVQYKDKSGNQMTSYKSNELTLDATKPTIKVSNIKANSANKDEKYGFVITVNDTNLDASSLKPVLKAVVQKEEGVYVTMDIDLGDAKTVVNGQTYTYTVEDLPDDGFYTLTCEVKDMSANGMSQIILDDSESYDQVQFSINRNGSAFGYGNKFSEELVGQYYIYSVDEDVVIVEVNVDPIEEYKVTLNGKELVEGTDYTTIQTSKDGEWSKRTYTIKKALFESEGEFSIIVSSTDKADTTAFSDVKNLSLAFVVDQTKPDLTITGLEAGGRYQTDAQTVTLIPTDEGGRLNSLTVLVLDSNGNPLKDDSGADVSVRFEMSGEELLKYLEENDGKVTFTVPEGLNNQVKIVCNDCAVNAEDLTNEYNELFERVTVSQNQFVIFYANTPLFVGTIVGVLAVAGLIVFLIKRKKDKKNKTAAKA